MKKKFLSLVAVGVTALTMNATAEIVFEETFETYADDAAFLAAYTVLGTVGDHYTLEEATGDGAEGSNKFLRVSTTGVQTYRKDFTSPIPMAEEGTIGFTLSGYLRVPASANANIIFGVRSEDGANSYVHIGRHNQAIIGGGGIGTKWGGRFLGLPGLPGGYYKFDNVPDVVADEWTKLSVEVTKSAMKVFVDDVEYDNFPLTGGSATPFNHVRLGIGIHGNLLGDMDNITVNATDTSVNDWNMY